MLTAAAPFAERDERSVDTFDPHGMMGETGVAFRERSVFVLWHLSLRSSSIKYIKDIKDKYQNKTKKIMNSFSSFLQKTAYKLQITIKFTEKSVAQ